MLYLVVLDWTGKRIPDELQLILRSVATKQHIAGAHKFYFEHEAGFGTVTDLGSKTLEHFSGRQFKAELQRPEQPKPQSFIFLLPRGSERHLPEAGELAIRSEVTKDGVELHEYDLGKLGTVTMGSLQ